jgi:uncharacterized protein YyaL (SSP411 family)
MSREKKAKEELKQKLASRAIDKEQLARDRKVTKDRNAVMIQAVNREIKFKTDEIVNGVVETLAIQRMPDGTMLKVEGYEGGKKPYFMIQNEIDMLTQRVKEFEQQIKDIEEAENADTEPEGKTDSEQ